SVSRSGCYGNRIVGGHLCMVPQVVPVGPARGNKANHKQRTMLSTARVETASFSTERRACRRYISPFRKGPNPVSGSAHGFWRKYLRIQHAHSAIPSYVQRNRWKVSSLLS